MLPSMARLLRVTKLRVRSCDQAESALVCVYIYIYVYMYIYMLIKSENI
jgi:hypothetical protein